MNAGCNIFLDFELKKMHLAIRYKGMKLHVRKHSGDLVEFDPGQLRNSLRKSGASEEDVADVIKGILPCLYEGMPTKAIYKLAFRFLKKKSHSYAARYTLKRALADLGPAGYYFEKWVARLFEYAGYQAVTSQKLQGNSVSHEIDVVAQKGSQQLLIECKFRNTLDARISVTTPMYFLSRVNDMSGRVFRFFGNSLAFTEGWLVTNTYWTKDAISFSEYHNVHLLGWDYPVHNSIKMRVDYAGLYPITCLTNLTKKDKDILLQHECILVKDLLNDRSLLDKLQIPSRKKHQVLEEATLLVENPIKDL